MRKFIAERAVALESHQGAVLSLEEEQLMETEAAATAAEVETDLSEAERVEEVSDALEDLAVIADGIDEATPAEINLIENSAAMAVAGTDIEPEEVLGTGTVIETPAIENDDPTETPAEPATPAAPVVPVEGETPAEPATVPAMESYKGKKIATEAIEAIVKKAKQIWEQIQKYLSKIWENIESFFYKMFAVVPGLRKRIKELQTRISETDGQAAAEKEITITTGVSALSVNYAPVKNEAELKKHFGEFSEMAKLSLGSIIDENCKFGEMVAASISKFDPSSAPAELGALNAKLKGAMGSEKYVKGGSGNASRFSGFKAHYSPAMMGNMSLVHKTPIGKENLSVLEEADQYRNAGISLVPTSDTTKEGPKEAKIATLSLKSMSDLLKDANDILDTMEEFKRGSRSKKMSAVRKELAAASDKATKAMDDAAKGDEAHKNAIPYYRSMLNFNTAYTRWSQSPAVPMFAHSITTIRAVMNVIGKSLAAYK